MDWQEARDRTLAQWRELRDSIDARDGVQLLTDINAICGLCDKALEDADGATPKCDFCIAAEQFGGCRAINAEMSLKVAEKDWDGLRQLVDHYIDSVRKLEIPGSSPAGDASP